MQRTMLLARAPLRSFTTSALRRTAATPAAAAPQLLSYFVGRTAAGELPCYSEIKKGGSLRQTLIRKIDGNVEDLRRDLSQFLDDVPSYTKPQSRQIILRGDWTKEVKEWLSSRGF